MGYLSEKPVRFALDLWTQLYTIHAATFSFE
jgi:hypothetical protein